uniref:J domain-containing protein n=1 Tax=Caenorhabditis japonica TaxID=281687 RepID=A0A8R1HSQ5_CAEJA
MFNEDQSNHKSSSNPIEKWSQHATTSAFGLMESLRGQGSSLAKNLKSFGKSLVKDQKSTHSGPPTPPEHRDDDIRLTWLTNRLVLADTLHNSKDGLLKAERAVVREMIDCQPYVVVNVHSEPLKLDGYAKSVHVPLGTSQKGGVPKYPTMQALIPILNEYCLLTNDAAIVIFGSDENVQITAAFCLIASRSLSRISDFLGDSLPNRFERLPTTYHLFMKQSKHICKLHARRQNLHVGVTLSSIVLEPGNVLIDGELYVAIQQGSNQLRVVEFSANSSRNAHGQIVVGLDPTEAVDDVIVFIGSKANVKHPLLAAIFNTQLLEPEDTSIVLTSSEMDVSRLVSSSQPVQDLRMIVNFATRRIPTLNSFQFDRYKLLCVRNERELDGYQKSYGDVDSEDESPILRNSLSASKKGNSSSSKSDFFDSLQFSDNHQHREKEPSLLNHEEDEVATTADLLGGFSIGGETHETPILTAPTPLSSEYDKSSQRREPSPAIDDLLDLGSMSTNSTSNTSQNVMNGTGGSGANLVDFDFGAPIQPTNSSVNLNSTPFNPTTDQSSWSNSDLLGGFSNLKPPTATPPNTRVSSAANSKPVSQVNSQSDFEAFLSNYPEKQSAGVSQKTQATKPQNSYKPAFGEAPSVGAKISSDAFGDLLSQGISVIISILIPYLSPCILNFNMLTTYFEAACAPDRHPITKFQNKYFIWIPFCSMGMSLALILWMKLKQKIAGKKSKMSMIDDTITKKPSFSSQWTINSNVNRQNVILMQTCGIALYFSIYELGFLYMRVKTIRDWTQGKDRNIRALLFSLDNVLWEGAGRWTKPGISDLLTPDQVKKYYRKACLVVHPDKLTGSPQLELAKMIFTELNDAYNKYQNDPTSM